MMLVNPFWFTPAGPSLFILDTFTGADGTALSSHTPEIGGNWVQNVSFGAGGLRIEGNTIQRSATTDSGSYSNTFFTPISKWYVELIVIFANIATEASVLLCRNGSFITPSDISSYFAWIRRRVSGGANSRIDGFGGANLGNLATPFTANTPYTIRLEFDTVGGTTVQNMYVNTVLVHTTSPAVPTPDWFSDRLLIRLTGVNPSDVSVDRIEVGPLA